MRMLIIMWLIVVLTAGCASDAAVVDDETAEERGTVVAVEGGLTDVSSFEILTEAGDRMVFEPSEGLLFDDAEPIGHLRDHMTSGHPVTVRYHSDGNRLIATYAGDAE